MANTIGLLHPGSMGSAVGAQLRRRGHTVLWCPDGRSTASHHRAEHAGLEPASLPDVVSRSDVVLSLCPPASAESVADQVAQCRAGNIEALYVEANAIAPPRMHGIIDRLAPMPVLDAAIIGSPPTGGKQPTLYLAGPATRCTLVSELLAGTDVRTHFLGKDIGKASALKLAYSSFQKVSRVLAAVAYGAADTYGVAEELVELAARRNRSYLTETDYIRTTADRAWRWRPELEDAAVLLADAGLPDSLMHAAAATLGRWEMFKDSDPDIRKALDALRADGPGTSAERADL